MATSPSRFDGGPGAGYRLFWCADIGRVNFVALQVVTTQKATKLALLPHV
jgi:hypothetical protein